MPWSWNESSHRYHDSATGRFMGRDEVLGYVQQSLDAARTAPAITLADGSLSMGTDLLSNLVGNGMLSPRDWHAQMREEIKAEYIRQYMLGRGGRGNMTAKDWGSIGGMVADQYRYLKDFAKLVAEGKLSEAQIRARAAMYVNSAREGFERGQARAFGLPELPAYPGDGQTICLTNCACSWQIEEVHEGEVLAGWDCYWTLGIVKTEHCDDCLDNTGKWNPLHINAEGEVTEGPTVPPMPEVPPEMPGFPELLEPPPEFEPEPPAELPFTPEGRFIPEQEAALQKDLEETQAAYRMALAAGNQTEADGIKNYMDTVSTSLAQEQKVNGALWENFGLTPDQATPDDWRRLSERLERDGYDLYKKYTKEGIQIEVQERRGARDSGYASVGSEIVLVKEGRFSRIEGQRLEGELWAQAKEELGQAFGNLLQSAGYSLDDIAQANYEQRRKLLEEQGTITRVFG